MNNSNEIRSESFQKKNRTQRTEIRMNSILVVLILVKALVVGSVITDSLKAELILRALSQLIQPSEQLDEILFDLDSSLKTSRHQIARRHYDSTLDQVIQSLLDRNLHNSPTFMNSLANRDR